MAQEFPLFDGLNEPQSKDQSKDQSKSKSTIEELEKKLWSLADELRANSNLKSSEYSVPVLGLIFLKYADYRFSKVEKELAGKATGRRQIGKTDYQLFIARSQVF